MCPDVLFSIGSFDIDLYKLLFLVGIIGMFAICIFTRKKYELSKAKAGVYTLLTFTFGVLGAKIMGYVQQASLVAVSEGEYDPGGSLCIFGGIMFLPVFILILSLFVKDSFRLLADYMTPGIFFVIAAGKMGCLMAGCCYGIPYENGIYNERAQCNVFPVQFFESICTFAVVAVLIILLAKSKRLKGGSLYPVGVIIYCSVRFVWEFFRSYESEYGKNFFAGLTYWQCWALVSVIFSAVWLLILYRSKKLKNSPMKRETIGLFIIADNVTRKKDEKNDRKHKEKAKKYQNKANEIKKQAHKK